MENHHSQKRVAMSFVVLMLMLMRMVMGVGWGCPRGRANISGKSIEPSVLLLDKLDLS